MKRFEVYQRAMADFHQLTNARPQVRKGEACLPCSCWLHRKQDIGNSHASLRFAKSMWQGEAQAGVALLRSRPAQVLGKNCIGRSRGVGGGLLGFFKF